MQALKRQAKKDWPEIRELAILGAPVFISLASNRSLSTISLSFVGSIGTTELSAAGLATSLANVSGESMLVGLTGAMQTLCGQAFGAKAYNEVGNIAQRTLLVLWTACIPITLLWWFSEPLLLSIGQAPEVASLCSVFLKWRLPGLWAYAVFSTIQGFLQTQRIVNPPAYANLLSALLHPFITYALIHPLGFGFAGAAVAYSISNIMEVSLLLALMLYKQDHKQCWGGLSNSAFQKWGEYMWLALPSMVMLGEWWSGEIVTVVSGRLPNPDRALAAMSIFQQTDQVVFMLPLGLGAAVAIRTANEVGAGRLKEAKHAAAVGVRLATAIALSLGTTILLARTQVVQIFTGDPALLTVAANVLIIMAFYIALDGFQVQLSGILRGTGRQAYAAPVIVFSHFVVGLPTALLLCFKAHLGVYGLCLGLFIGSLTNVGFYSYLVITTPWEKVHEQAKQRSGGGKGDEHEQLTNDEEDSEA